MRKNEISRLKNIIDCDRLNGGNNFERVFLIDIERVLGEYFDYSKPINLKINKEQGGFFVDISFNAYSIKQFDNLPK